jgi:transcriptional regulator with XRE-family HTH domain
VLQYTLAKCMTPSQRGITLASYMTQPPKTPGELLAEAIERAGLTKAELGRRVGSGYARVHRWTKNQEFTPANRKMAAGVLGLAIDAFDNPDAIDERELERQRAFHDFLRRPIGKTCPESVLRVLESVRFLDPLPRPSVAFYETCAAVLLGQIPEDEAAALAEYNDGIDRTPPHKRP